MNRPSNTVQALVLGAGLATATAGCCPSKPAECYNQSPVHLGAQTHSGGNDSPYASIVTVANLEGSECWTPPLNVKLEGGCEDPTGTIRLVTYRDLGNLYGKEQFGVAFTRAGAVSEELDSRGKHYPCEVPMDVWAGITEVCSGQYMTSDHLSLSGNDPQPATPDDGSKEQQ